MSFLRSKWMISITIGLIGVFLFGFGKSYVRDYNVNKEIRQLEADQQALEKERSNLSTLLKKIQSTAYAEEQAREEFGMRKPGEKTAVIQRVDTQKQNENITELQEYSNPYRWWLRFFGQDTKKTM